MSKHRGFAQGRDSDRLQDFVDGMADECGGYPVLIGVAALFLWMLTYVAIYR